MGIVLELVATICVYEFKMPAVNKKVVRRLPIKISVDSMPWHAIVGVVFTVGRQLAL